MNWGTILPFFTTLMKSLGGNSGGGTAAPAQTGTTPGTIYQPPAKPQIATTMRSTPVTQYSYETPRSQAMSVYPMRVPVPVAGAVAEAAPAPAPPEPEPLSSDEVDRIKGIASGQAPTPESVTNAIVKPTETTDLNQQHLFGGPQTLDIAGANADRATNAAKAVATASRPMTSGASMGPGKSSGSGTATSGAESDAADGFMASVGATLLASLLKPQQAAPAAPQRQRGGLPEILQPYERPGIYWRSVG